MADVRPRVGRTLVEPYSGDLARGGGRELHPYFYGLGIAARVHVRDSRRRPKRATCPAYGHIHCGRIRLDVADIIDCANADRHGSVAGGRPLVLPGASAGRLEPSCAV